MKIYTKTGDKGQTSLLDGKRISKDCLEMHAIGEIDELNSALGLLIAELEEEGFTKEKIKLISIQRKLFVIGSQIAAVQTKLIKVPPLASSNIRILEQWIDSMDRQLPRLTAFILPGGNEESALAFHARAICRRVERQIIALSKIYAINPRILQYLNRLSDALFVLGRYINHTTNTKEILWKK